MKYFPLLFLLCTFSASCQQQIPVDDIEQLPIFAEADEAFKEVYKPLDGKWKGDFLIYEDTVRGGIDENRLYQLDTLSLRHPSLKLSNSIQVEQQYESLSPYFQTVTITDFYPDQSKTVTSKGVNKVQDGKMWCVVRKPDETVIHEGSTDGPSTIIWQRDLKEPTRKEYFYETVRADTYEIIGWGYYDGDDVTQMPKYWFYGAYKRQ